MTLNRGKLIILLMATFLALPFSASAAGTGIQRRVSTRITKAPGGKVKKEKGKTDRKDRKQEPEEDGHWLQPEDSLFAVMRPGLEFSGYDKKLTSTRESLFVSNNTGRRILGLRLTIVYRDMKGRELHSRELTLMEDIADGHRRHLDFKSWDTQKAFYSHRSVPKRSAGTPYKVQIHVQGICIADPLDK